uniref:Major sperm protein n=1 Tax=Heterorhabditis bacteriophora TaxID=37862 RepID=A0A1I7WAD1_HETBA
MNHIFFPEEHQSMSFHQTLDFDNVQICQLNHPTPFAISTDNLDINNEITGLSRSVSSASQNKNGIHSQEILSHPTIYSDFDNDSMSLVNHKTKHQKHDKLNRKYMSSLRFVHSMKTPLLLTRTIPSLVSRIAETEYIFNPSTKSVSLLIAPPQQEIKDRKISRQISRTKLMLAPNGPLETESLHPFWRTTTYRIASGKHLAIEHYIPKISIKRTNHVKCEMHSSRNIDIYNVYPDMNMKYIELWHLTQAHSIKLSSVEVDPYLVKSVRLEEKCIHSEGTWTSRITNDSALYI